MSKENLLNITEEEFKDRYADERSRLESLTDEELNIEIQELESKIDF